MSGTHTTHFYFLTLWTDRSLYSSCISARVSVPWALLNSLHLTRTNRKPNARQETKIKHFMTKEKCRVIQCREREKNWRHCIKTLSKIWQVGSIAVKCWHLYWLLNLPDHIIFVCFAHMLIIMFCSHIIYKDIKGWPFLIFQDVAKVTNLFFLFFYKTLLMK